MPYLYASATQGGADAFVQAELATALTGQTRNAYRVQEITLELAQRIVAVNASDLSVAITRRSKAAMPNITDVDVIRKFTWAVGVAGASGAVAEETIVVWTPPAQVLIVEDPLYIQLDSTSTALTNTAIIRIEYEVVNISDIDRLTLLTQSLV